MTKHALSRPTDLRQLKVAASVLVAVLFVVLFVGGATGMIGGGDGRDDESLVGVDGPPSADPPAATDPAAPDATADPTADATPVLTDVPPQEIKGSRKLEHTLAWLRRGLADETTFRVATFNVLGDSHTAKGGNKKGWASGVTRMGWAYSLIQQADLDVVGFQEFETTQYNAFRNLAGSDWSLYPGPTLDTGSIRDSIAWRNDRWEEVEETSIAIPYFHGQLIRRPVVKLKNIESGREVWFFNTHNPADTPRWGNNSRWRAGAINLEIGLANQLGADGTPVIFTGDYNDRDAAFCPLVGGTDLAAANGGSNDGSCDLPSSPDIDWIFGSGVQWTGFVSASQGIVGRVSDHPFVYAESYIPEEPLGGQPTDGATDGATGGPTDGASPSESASP